MELLDPRYHQHFSRKIQVKRGMTVEWLGMTEKKRDDRKKGGMTEKKVE